MGVKCRNPIHEGHRLKTITIPRFSKSLAYFLGLLLGDGSVGLEKPTIQLTFHEVDEEEFCSRSAAFDTTIVSDKTRLLQVEGTARIPDHV